MVKKYKNGGTYLKFAQSTINTGYLIFVVNFFYSHGLCKMTTPTGETPVVKGKRYAYLQFSTKSLKE